MGSNQKDLTPDVSMMDAAFFGKRYDLANINIKDTVMLDFAKNVLPLYRTEFDALARSEKETKSAWAFHRNNCFYGHCDVNVLYSILRDKKPGRIIECGSGFTSRLIAETLEKYNSRCKYTAVDPYPAKALGSLPIVKAIKERAQDLPVEFYQTLQAGDILFIDSSHIAAADTDSTFLILEVLPKLNSGVIIHFHDIFLPEGYPEHWLKQGFFWNEQYLLHAFLQYNRAFKVLWISHYMHLEHSHVMQEAFASWQYPKEKKYAGGHALWIEKL